MSRKTTREELLVWSQRAGPETYAAFSRRLEVRNLYVSDVYFCIEVRELSNKFGTKVIEAAFKELHSNGGNPTLKLIRKYVSNAQAGVSVYGPDYSADVHATGGITRGRNSFVSSDI